jgi:DNA-binding SARP family transcriptional activator
LRALLAVLLWRAGRPVSADEIAELVWDGEPPRQASDATRALVMRLRRQLDERAAARITTHPPGYAIEISGDELDAAQFETLTRQAGVAIRAGQWAQAGRNASQALGLWRGVPLADVPSQMLRDRWVPHLDQLHVQALEWHIEANLHQGRHEELIPELQDLTAIHPLRERFHGQLMLALYQSGRQAEALAAYSFARDVLISELGIEPGPNLRDLYQQVLDSAPVLAAAPPARLAGAETMPVKPRDLPLTVPEFTGRSAELQALTALLDRPGQQAPGAVVISAIGGTAGVGKTTLAVHWAHQVADRFADGQLHANLRGFDPTGKPADPAEVVRGFLNALGVAREHIPPTASAQTALYRSLLADRQMLIVLDNARDERQVRPLLPASQGSLVIITSRNQLAGLAVDGGAQLLGLDLLTQDEAVQLLTTRIGNPRAAAEPGAVDEIARLCAHLPLALAVTAARAAARPRFLLSQLADELRSVPGRLDALDTGDPTVSVRAVFSWSYAQLSSAAARLFRLLGLHAGPDISVPAAASLAKIGQAEAVSLLRELARDCLITEHAPGRYAFHDLLRAYAASQAQEFDSQPDREAAIARVLDYYLYTADRGANLLSPSRDPLALAAPAAGVAPERPADQRQAVAWFEAEHQVLLAAIALAAETGEDRRAWQLSWAMIEYLYWGGYLHERIAIMSGALAAATRIDDTLGQAISLRCLGNFFIAIGKYDQARAHLDSCLPLFQRLGDRHGEARVRRNLSLLADDEGRYRDALMHSQEALRLYRAVGNETGEAEVLGNVGWCHALLGEYEQAREFCEQSLTLCAKLGGLDVEYGIRDTLGYIALHTGDFAQATAHFEIALGFCRQHGHRSNEADLLNHVGDARHAVGELQQARQAWQQALAIYDDIDHHDADKVRAKLASLKE